VFCTYSWPEAIIHIDGDAFFASVMQSLYPSLKGKPVITGKERGIATAISYEAKRLGVTRGMRLSEIKRICPSCIWIESDYDAFTLVSQRMFDIIRTYSPFVEEYSIDEGFIDIKGLRRMHRKTYKEIALSIKQEVEQKLDISVSVGLSITKSLAKLASSFRKPSGFTPVKGKHIEYLLKLRKVDDIWGLGHQTKAYLRQFNIHSAFDFANLSLAFVQKHLSKPFVEIWYELRGTKIYSLQTERKSTYKSISKTQTFSPATNNKELLWAYLLEHIENAFHKARDYKYVVGKVFLFLKTQQFEYRSTEVSLLTKTGHPLLVRKELRCGFDHIYSPLFLYRTTGCTITDLHDAKLVQTSLFDNNMQQKKSERLYTILESNPKVDFGTSVLIAKKQHVIKQKKKMSIPLVSLQQVS